MCFSYNFNLKVRRMFESESTSFPLRFLVTRGILLIYGVLLNREQGFVE
jgi:hypothetical protein